MDVGDKLIQLDAVRIERNKPRKCTCKIRKFTVDISNNEITCGCGMIVNPFEAMAYMATNYERINEEHKALNAQRKQWIKEKPHSIIFKRLEQSYQRGSMLPCCPTCNQAFDFKNVTRFINAEFHKKLQGKSKSVKCPGCGWEMVQGTNYEHECVNPTCGEWVYEEEERS